MTEEEIRRDIEERRKRLAWQVKVRDRAQEDVDTTFAEIMALQADLEEARRESSGRR